MGCIVRQVSRINLNLLVTSSLRWTRTSLSEGFFLRSGNRNSSKSCKLSTIASKRRDISLDIPRRITHYRSIFSLVAGHWACWLSSQRQSKALQQRRSNVLYERLLGVPPLRRRKLFNAFAEVYSFFLTSSLNNAFIWHNAIHYSSIISFAASYRPKHW